MTKTNVRKKPPKLPRIIRKRKTWLKYIRREYLWFMLDHNIDVLPKTKPQIKRCKYCGGVPVVWHISIGEPEGYYYASCETCHWTTKSKKRKALAIYVWNKEAGA